MAREIFRHFTSITEYVALRTTPTNHGKDFSTGTERWFGCSSREEALAICRAGTWPEGVARMERELAGFETSAATSVRRTQTWSDQGDALDIHRVNAGQLDVAWRRTQRRSRRASQSVVVSFPLMIAAADHANKLFWCGAAALKLTDVLTQAGYNVALIGTHGTQFDGHVGHDSLVVKAAEAPLDVEALIVAMAFPGFTRTAGFTAIASNPFTVNSGLGNAIYDDPAPLAALNLPTGNVIRGLYAAVHGAESARRWIAAQLAALDSDAEHVAVSH